MESCMVGKWTFENNKIIKDFFKENFPNFFLVTEISHGPNWGVKYSNDDLIINIKGDIGFNTEIIIGDESYDLSRFDKNVTNHLKTSSENILYHMMVLKNFLA